MRSFDNPKSDNDDVLFYRYLTETHLKNSNELRAKKTNLVIENVAIKIPWQILPRYFLYLNANQFLCDF